MTKRGMDEMDERERYAKGDARRRTVLGDAHVDRSRAAETDFNADLFELVTRYAWGDVWTRPGLDTTTRRLLVLAMTVALNREREFKLHLRAALADGVPRETVKEVLLQTAIYCGVPAAHSAFHHAAEVFAEVDA
jgi:4-carboxymuconolactone decarboxylase